MKHNLKFIDLKHGEIVILPNEFQNPITKQPFDYIQLAGDHVVFGLSTGTHLETKNEWKTIRELYEERKK